MKYISIHETKNHLSRLLRRVAAGEEIVIARRGTPIARIVPLAPSETRQLGIDKGRITVPDDFNRPIEEDRKDHANL
jgi:prevent-host-death family protein